MRHVFSLLILPVVLFTSLNRASAHPEAVANNVVTVESTSCEIDPPLFITWFAKEVTCPVCSTKNIFMEPGSWGSYVYQYPSKYQLIFWPHTDSPTWHSCKKCKLTLFMGEFESLPKEKIPALVALLKTVTLPAQKEVPEKEVMDNPPYLSLSVSDRLVVAEKVYRALGKDSDKFWAHFYRVMAYHFDNAKKETEAAEARNKVLKIVQGWVADQSKAGERKEFLYISGAMHHFLKDDVAAKKDFEEASLLTYSSADVKPENNQNYDKYLGTLIKEYLDMLKEGKGPRNKPDIARNNIDRP